MAKILRVSVQDETEPLYELVATNAGDVGPNWIFKTKHFRYVYTPWPHTLVTRWMNEMEANLPLWTNDPTIRRNVSFIRGLKKNIYEHVLYQGDPDDVPTGEGRRFYFDSKLGTWVMIDNLTQQARRDLNEIQSALQRGDNVSFFDSNAIPKVLAVRAEEVLREKHLREGLYRDMEQLVQDARTDNINIEAGPLDANEVYQDAQHIKNLYYGYLLEELEGRRQYAGPATRYRDPLISYGDPLPSRDDLRRMIANDYANIKRTLGQDPWFDLPFFVIVDEFYQYIVDEFNRRAEAEGLAPTY
jgi:hypothetical protein